MTTNGELIYENVNEAESYYVPMSRQTPRQVNMVAPVLNTNQPIGVVNNRKGNHTNTTVATIAVFLILSILGLQLYACVKLIRMRDRYQSMNMGDFAGSLSRVQSMIHSLNSKSDTILKQTSYKLLNDIRSLIINDLLKVKLREFFGLKEGDDTQISMKMNVVLEEGSTISIDADQYINVERSPIVSSFKRNTTHYIDINSPISNMIKVNNRSMSSQDSSELIAKLVDTPKDNLRTTLSITRDISTNNPGKRSTTNSYYNRNFVSYRGRMRGGLGPFYSRSKRQLYNLLKEDKQIQRSSQNRKRSDSIDYRYIFDLHEFGQKINKALNEAQHVIKKANRLIRKYKAECG
nr:ORFX [Guato paramyxovirus]